MDKNVNQVCYEKGRRYIPFGPQEWEGFPAFGFGWPLLIADLDR